MAIVIITSVTRLDDSERVSDYRVNTNQNLFGSLHGYMPPTITEKISTAVIPATTVTRITRKGNLNEEEGGHPMEKVDKDLEARIYEIEKRLNNFQAMVMRGKVREESLPRYLEN